MIRKIIGTLIVVLVLNFFMPRMMPGDPFDFLSTEEGQVTVTLSEEQIQFYRAYYGMDEPLKQQFIDYVKRAFTGDFGISVYYNRPVSTMILERVAWTMALVLISLAVSSLIGTVLGMIAAYRASEETTLDAILMRGMIILSEMPDFMIGLAMLFVFAAKLKWFPLSGGATAFAVYETFGDAVKDYAHHAVLPCLVLILSSMGDFFLLSRQSMMAILREPYITTAVAKGLGNRRILSHHVLLNAFSPILARIFMKLGTMLGGAVLVENVFAYPGVGRLMREAVGLRDYVMIQGIFFYVAIFVLVFNLVADIIIRLTNRSDDYESN